MKKYKVVSAILFLIISLSLVACFCAGCDFIQYVENSDNSRIVSEEVKQLQEEYVDKLYNVTSQIEYRENEQKLYEYAVQDAVNELYECFSETDLKQVYDKHLVIIGKIKTDKEYSDEEESNAISAYRVAILAQAEVSYDKKKYSETQIAYFDTVFAVFSGALFETNVREEMNGLLQKLYFNLHKEDIILGLINYADISIYEDSQKDILTDTLDKCIEDIRNCVNEEDIEDIKSIYVFEVYKRNTVKKLNEYISLQLYRDEQVAQIKSILKEHLELAEEAETNIEEDNIFREYQIAVYSIPTDEMLYNEELEELKKELNSSLISTYKLSFYRESEGLAVQELLKSFEDILEATKKKEDVLSQYVLLKNRLDSVKTANVLDAEDRVNLIEELYIDLQNRIEKNIDGLDKDIFLLKAKNTYLNMQDRVSLDGVRAEYRVLANEISAKFGAALDILKEELSEYNSTVFYREKEQNKVFALKEEYLSKFTDEFGIDGVKALLQEAKNAINEIKTNDDLWNDSVTKFRADLKSLYGDAILEEPQSLTEANDYYELANIIDYYAFYQLSGTEFVCDTFRVKLNFDHNDALWERNEVYWYCELIRSAVGLTANFENGSFLVFNLIPYEMATNSNRRDINYLNRFKNLAWFDSDKSQMTVRFYNFDDFAYYKYGRTINVWNSQQLWYALEHEYVPICEPDSPAELVMNRAKEILREIIMEGMSDEEKIFQIYSWFGENVQFDNLYFKYFGSTDLDMFPDEQAATLKSFHAEGALIDRLSVCEGYAKSYLILLRLEGIESYRIFIRDNNLKGINSINAQKSINYGGYGSHAFCIIGLDGKYFFSDTEKSFVNGREALQSIQQLLAPPSLSAGSFRGFTYMYPDISYEEEISDIFNNIKFISSIFVNNLAELQAIINDFEAIENSGVQLTIIFKYNLNDYSLIHTDLINMLSGLDYVEKPVSNVKYIIKEFIVYQ